MVIRSRGHSVTWSAGHVPVGHVVNGSRGQRVMWSFGHVVSGSRG